MECDATLMKNHATTSLLSKLLKLNVLFASAGYLTSRLKGRDKTIEGLDKKLLNYYGKRKIGGKMQR